MKKIIAPFVLDILVATAGTYVAVSQLLEGFSWLPVAILATLAGANIFAAFKLGTTDRFKFSSTAAAGAVLLAWMIYVSIVSGIGALAVIGMVVGCAQIVIAIVAGRIGADGSVAQEDVQAKLPLLAARCVALGIGLGILSLLPRHNIDIDRAIWLLGLAVVLLAITRIAEMGNKNCHRLGRRERRRNKRTSPPSSFSRQSPRRRNYWCKKQVFGQQFSEK